MPFCCAALQLGLGMPAWLIAVSDDAWWAAAAMGMKLIASRVLARFGYRRVLTVTR